MTGQDVQIILQKALEKYPEAKPRIISDNGPQFIARDCIASVRDGARHSQQFIRLTGVTHERTSPGYPQSNGNLARWHGSLKPECIRPTCPASLNEARRRVAAFVEHYSHLRLHSTIRYVTPADKLNGLEPVVFAERDRKLEGAWQRRQRAHQSAQPLTEVAG